MASTGLIDRGDMPPAPVHRFTVEQYHRMIDSGVLTEKDRVELLEGWILPKMPQHPPHAGTIGLVGAQLGRVLPESHVLRGQLPITLADSEPEPDWAVAVGPLRRYVEEHPTARDVALVIEVADTTLDQDRGLKQRVYARARIPIYWIVNVVDGQVEVYSQPRAGKAPAYRRREDLRGEQLVSLVIDGKEVARLTARDLLP